MRLLVGIEHYLQMSVEEQIAALQDSLPSMEEYLSRRMNTSAVEPCLTISEYVCMFEIYHRSFLKTSKF